MLYRVSDKINIRSLIDKEDLITGKEIGITEPDFEKPFGFWNHGLKKAKNYSSNKVFIKKTEKTKEGL